MQPPVFCELEYLFLFSNSSANEKGTKSRGGIHSRKTDKVVVLIFSDAKSHNDNEQCDISSLLERSLVFSSEDTIGKPTTLPDTRHVPDSDFS